MSLDTSCFEISWEICNMVGGIHTVISTKVSKMREHYEGSYFVFGPDLGFQKVEQKAFLVEEWDLDLARVLSDLPVPCRLGRWLIPGDPKCILVNFSPLIGQKEKILAHYWERDGVDSLLGGPDYYEPLLFGHAVGMVIERMVKYWLSKGRHKAKFVAHCHEWLTGSAVLYLQEKVPELATVFTTHATVLGRAISAANPRTDLPSLLSLIKPESAAHDYHVVAKHSLESIAARRADCFTTVSSLTAEECIHILGRRPDVITLNGLGENLPPSMYLAQESVFKARKRLFDLAEAVTKFRYDRNQTLIYVTSGRYEFVNKGGDLFIHALSDLRGRMDDLPGKRIIAFAMYPAAAGAPKRSLFEDNAPPGLSTHELLEEAHDPLVNGTRELQLRNDPKDLVHLIFIPVYLMDSDPLIQEPYWQLLAGADLGVFPSWYEPWGYTPQEAISLGVPAISSDLAGFGQWAEGFGDLRRSGVALVRRQKQGFDKSKRDLTDLLHHYATLSDNERREIHHMALETSQQARWRKHGWLYLKAHEFAQENARRRLASSEQERLRSAARWPSTFRAGMRDHALFSIEVQVVPKLPFPFDQIYEFCRQNLWWYWAPSVAQVFMKLDAGLWLEVKGDPRKFLESCRDEVLEMATQSRELREMLEKLIDQYIEECKPVDAPQVAYFCLEYGLADRLKLYSGGLGILAGDYLKSLSDKRYPVVAIGLGYSHGYFFQTLNREGCQESRYERNDFSAWPMTLVTDSEHKPLRLVVPFPGDRGVHVRIWRMMVGALSFYLLDTDLDENSPEFRTISVSLYGGEPTLRLRQEWLIGIGGVMLLKVLNLKPSVYHMNEGHTSFLILARISQLMSQGIAQRLTFEEAFELVRGTTVFTTHTSVPAGHDHFPPAMVSPYLEILLEELGVPIERLMEMGLGAIQGYAEDFSTTALAIRGSRFINAVSPTHQRVSQKIFHHLFQEFPLLEVPIENVSNGVHASTWIAPEWQALFFEAMGKDWVKRLQDEDFWKFFSSVDPKSVWQAHVLCKQRLISTLKTFVLRKLRDSAQVHKAYGAVLATLEHDPIILTHARRNVAYKRAEVLFYDRERLRSLVKGKYPILFVFGGKAHPRDQVGQNIIQRVIEISRYPEFQGHILFIENYEIDLAKTLVSGSDVWLNTPLRGMEASGTSGMKAAMNGCLHASVLDGWWVEGYNGENGWAVGESPIEAPEDIQYEYDNRALLSLLEHEIVPAYYDRDGADIPRRWVDRMKESIATILPRFNSERMLSDYERLLYKPALHLAHFMGEKDFVALHTFAAAKKRLINHWQEIRAENIDVRGYSGEKAFAGEPFQVSLKLVHPGIETRELRVQAIFEDGGRRGVIDLMPLSGGEPNRSLWKAELTAPALGSYELRLRVLSNLVVDGEQPEMLSGLIRWL